MTRKVTFADLRTAAEAMPAPTSQVEWRAVSRALRTARRAWPRSNAGVTLQVQCGSSARRIDLPIHGGPPLRVGYYNGPSPLSHIAMIGFQRKRYLDGCRAGRVISAHQLAQASRRSGPIPIPGSPPGYV